jgi:hypothetical protein
MIQMFSPDVPLRRELRDRRRRARSVQVEDYVVFEVRLPEVPTIHFFRRRFQQAQDLSKPSLRALRPKIAKVPRQGKGWNFDSYVD